MPTVASEDMEDKIVYLGVFVYLFEHLSVLLPTFFFLHVFKFEDVFVFDKEIFLKEILGIFAVVLGLRNVWKCGLVLVDLTVQLPLV